MDIDYRVRSLIDEALCSRGTTEAGLNQFINQTLKHQHIGPAGNTKCACTFSNLWRRFYGYIASDSVRIELQYKNSVVTHGNIRVESGDVKRAGSMIFFHGWYVWVTAQEWAATVLHFVGSRSRRPISSSRPCILVEIEGMWFDCLFTAFIYVQHHLCEPLDLLFCWSRVSESRGFWEWDAAEKVLSAELLQGGVVVDDNNNNNNNNPSRSFDSRWPVMILFLGFVPVPSAWSNAVKPMRQPA
ncbi:hypothetical protein I7I51_02022 [Histoplasma capsulatum]|uniref:Uncharacterized protein n=1 Tax=Ajellomyces capsulatus TaxID=5037 RepID=A0A8A1MEM4_AJECA|nr:hypothetical protein I7I51_02022 [Histoplasma capsulatum]